MLKETWRIMRKHQKHCFDNSQTGGSVVTVSIFMHLKCVFQITMKKFVPNSGPNFGGASYTQVQLIFEKYGK